MSTRARRGLTTTAAHTDARSGIRVSRPGQFRLSRIILDSPYRPIKNIDRRDPVPTRRASFASGPDLALHAHLHTAALCTHSTAHSYMYKYPSIPFHTITNPRPLFSVVQYTRVLGLQRATPRRGTLATHFSAGRFVRFTAAPFDTTSHAHGSQTPHSTRGVPFNTSTPMRWSQS